MFSSDEEDYRGSSRRSHRSHRGHSSKSRHRHRSSVSPEHNARNWDRETSPCSRYCHRSRSSYRSRYDERKGNSGSSTFLRKEKSSGDLDKIINRCVGYEENKDKIERKAEAKLSALSKLGLELKLPEPDKKKKLWSSKTDGGSSVWDSANFGDSKATAKFKRLMGIKDPNEAGCSTSSSSVTQQQQKLFEKMEVEYEVARQTTHTLRGVGLGFPKLI